MHPAPVLAPAHASTRQQRAGQRQQDAHREDDRRRVHLARHGPRGRDFLEKPFEGDTLLSPRERQVLALVVKGMPKQIAGALGAAEKTIKIRRGRMMGKMDAASVAELVRMYTVGFAPTLASIRLPVPSP